MSKASRQARPPRPTSAQRREAQLAAKRRRKWWIVGSLSALVVLAGVLIGLHISNGTTGTSSSASTPLRIGSVAPNGSLTTLDGQTTDISALRGRPALIWFVSTWCSSCQAGTQTMAQNLNTLRSDGVHVDEVELYQDLGQSGPSLGTFAKSLAGSQFVNPDWTFALSSASLTHIYDPQSYLDIYYLLNADGKITYVNGSPASTMPQLLAAAKRLS